MSEKKCDCGKKNVTVEVTKPPKTWEEDDTFVGPFTIRTGDGGDHTYSWRYTEMIKANNSAITDPKISGREVPEEFLEVLSDASSPSRPTWATWLTLRPLCRRRAFLTRQPMISRCCSTVWTRRCVS